MVHETLGLLLPVALAGKLLGRKLDLCKAPRAAVPEGGFQCRYPLLCHVLFSWVAFHNIKLSVCVLDLRSSLGNIAILVPPFLTTTARKLPALVTTVEG